MKQCVFFQATYFIEKDLIFFNKKIVLCALLANIKRSMTKNLYHDEKSFIQMILNILYVVQKKWMELEILNFMVS